MTTRPGLDLLHEPGHPASVATVTPRKAPALAMMWFAFADERLWFHTPAPEAGPPSPFLVAADAGELVSAMVATFHAPQDIRQVRVTGRAALERRDEARVETIYERYVPELSSDWRPQIQSPSYHLWSLSPERGMAVSYAGLQNSEPFRWSAVADLLAALRPET